MRRSLVKFLEEEDFRHRLDAGQLDRSGFGKTVAAMPVLWTAFVAFTRCHQQTRAALTHLTFPGAIKRRTDTGPAMAFLHTDHFQIGNPAPEAGKPQEADNLTLFAGDEVFAEIDTAQDPLFAHMSLPIWR